MPSLKDIRGRIGSVRNIAQITRAMEMVAASRMKRAQDSILAARPYADELEGALERVAQAAGLSEEVDPLLASRPVRRAAIIVVTTDRGLAGSLNATATRAVLRWVTERASRSNGERDARSVTQRSTARVALAFSDPARPRPRASGRLSTFWNRARPSLARNSPIPVSCRPSTNAPYQGA